MQPNVPSAQQVSLLKMVFGEDMGGMLEVMLGMIVVMAVFAGIPAVIMSHRRASRDEAAVLKELPPDTRSVIQDLAAVQVHSQQLVSKLQSDITHTESLLEDKQRILAQLQAQVALLRLSPEQRTIVERYNASIDRDAFFRDWIRRRTTWYELVSGFLVSLFFYVLGLRRGAKAQRMADSAESQASQRTAI